MKKWLYFSRKWRLFCQINSNANIKKNLIFI